MKLTLTARDGVVTVTVDHLPDQLPDGHLATVLSRALTDWLDQHPAALTIPAPRRTSDAAMRRHTAVRQLLIDHLSMPDRHRPFPDRLAALLTDLAPHLRSPR